jgi:predicted pyridoxine 5'-phosphate oxidase superfamily flavin-nucleotide-binding protein
MDDDPMYHDGMRQLQDLRETRPLADRLEQVTVRTAFTDEDRAFIQRCPMFFIATAYAHGHPDCPHKGGLPGFVHVLDDRTLAIPDYDGNGMYRTRGNVLLNPHVGLLFLDFEHPKRLRVNGTARIAQDDPLLAEYPARCSSFASRRRRSFRIAGATSTRCNCSSIRSMRRGPSTRHPFRRGRRSTFFAMPCRVATAPKISRSEPPYRCPTVQRYSSLTLASTI